MSFPLAVIAVLGCLALLIGLGCWSLRALCLGALLGPSSGSEQQRHVAISSTTIAPGLAAATCSCGGSWWWGLRDGDPSFTVALEAHANPGLNFAQPGARFTARLYDEHTERDFAVDADGAIHTGDRTVNENTIDIDTIRAHHAPAPGTTT